MQKHAIGGGHREHRGSGRCLYVLFGAQVIQIQASVTVVKGIPSLLYIIYIQEIPKPQKTGSLWKAAARAS